MLKKGFRLFLIIAASVALIGCGEGEEKLPAADNGNQKQETVDKDSDVSEDIENTDNSQKEEDTVDQEQGTATTEAEIKVYFSNEDATGFSEETVTLPALSEEEVLKALVAKGSVAGDVKLLSMKQSEKDGEKVLELDFSPELETYMSSLGTTGEYMTIGSICNTYLDVYGCEKVRITVNGDTLTTGHAEYPGYMGKFK